MSGSLFIPKSKKKGEMLVHFSLRFLNGDTGSMPGLTDPDSYGNKFQLAELSLGVKNLAKVASNSSLNFGLFFRNLALMSASRVPW